jgi:NAD(P)-dependent dehydrogenase (short-subunit alcohol dehydrogenase family)
MLPVKKLDSSDARYTTSPSRSLGSPMRPTRDLTYLDPQRIADAALWLVSDAAAAVTGVALPVEAGHLLMPGVYTGA